MDQNSRRLNTENMIRIEMKWLYRATAEIDRYKADRHPLSEELKKYLAWAVLPVVDRIEMGKALRLRIRLFGSTRFSLLPAWVTELAEVEPEGLDKRITERLRADLYRRVGFIRLELETPEVI